MEHYIKAKSSENQMKNKISITELWLLSAWSISLHLHHRIWTCHPRGMKNVFRLWCAITKFYKHYSHIVLRVFQLSLTLNYESDNALSHHSYVDLPYWTFILLVFFNLYMLCVCVVSWTPTLQRVYCSSLSMWRSCCYFFMRTTSSQHCTTPYRASSMPGRLSRTPASE